MKTNFEPGAPMEEGGIPLCVPEIHGNEWAYIKECLDTGFVSSVGLFVDRFEKELAKYTGAAYAVATSSGTAALHIALLVAGVAADDEVAVPALTFIAPVNSIRYAGAWPVFMDVELDYWQMDPQHVIDFINKDCRWTKGELHNRHTGRRVRAIMPVHILGHPVDMDPIHDLATKFNLVVIEDATESLGAKYKGRMTGTMGHIGCFSFNGNKIITTGGGGMIVTDDENWASKAKYLTTQAKDDPVEFIHNEVGYNYRLTNIQAALGCAQMERLDDYIATKRKIAARYTQAFLDLPGITPMRQAAWAESIFWMYTILVDERTYGMGSRELMRKAAGFNIQARPFWHPIHSLALYSDCHALGGVNAELLYARGLSLPCSVGLDEEQQEQVISLVAGRI